MSEIKTINRNSERIRYHVRLEDGGIGIHGYLSVEDAASAGMDAQSYIGDTYAFRPKFSIVKRTTVTNETITDETVWGK